ncbi:DinB family protein [Curtobacterium sp. MCBD17_040]|uniref:DinB family protein n=1 Tax=Curtobacterium sp. MCBD17_040 TaxID=2175674 RepID=UPI000DAA48DB|nr:DinB family protein [Curtobacterium sp. MCBD17_040]WIB64297.1 DinB family protein [Curtobacterium sp. MCBD17_040]
MPIEPDTKNWTWVLEDRCPECGFDGRTVTFDEVPGLVRANAAAWPAELARDDVRERPDDATWSPLEYGAHVRDVHRVMAGRLELMLAEDAPRFPNWDQDATAVEDRYGEQDSAVVAEELLAAADRTAAAFAAVRDDQVDRPGLRSDGSAFTVESLARYYLHDPVHHLADVRRPRA